MNKFIAVFDDPIGCIHHGQYLNYLNYCKWEYEIHVINKLPINTPQLKVHCASKDDEIANKYVAINEDLHWSFCESFSLSTLYFCNFWWGPKNKSITVFDDVIFCIHHGLYENLLHYCKWEVRQDGFYLEMYNTTAGNNTYFMDHDMITPLNLSTTKACFLTNRFEVHVINNLPSNASLLKIHCASGDDDLGDHYLAVNQEFKWSFCQALAWTTLFFCHFWWDSKSKVFNVFDDPVHCVEDGLLPKITTQCAWVVKSDVYITNKLPSHSPKLTFHCASKNDDLGYHDLAINQ
ncbi:hypothetical protein H5410_048797, partial [Solanum commersonii]